MYTYICTYVNLDLYLHTSICVYISASRKQGRMSHRCPPTSRPGLHWRMSNQRLRCSGPQGTHIHSHTQIYIHVCMHACKLKRNVHTYKYTTCIHTHIYTYVTHMHTYIQAYKHTNIYSRVCMFVCLYLCLYVCMFESAPASREVSSH